MNKILDRWKGTAIDIAQVQREIDSLDGQLSDVKTRMAQYLRELGLDE